MHQSSKPWFLQIDWRSWLTVAWASTCGILYVRMILQERAPGVLEWIQARFAG